MTVIRDGIDNQYVGAAYLQEAARDGARDVILKIRRDREVRGSGGMYLSVHEMTVISDNCNSWITEKVFRDYVGRVHEERQWAKQEDYKRML
jgi:hypothetical protein